jgi:para-nitrobenzyl esterase
MFSFLWKPSVLLLSMACAAAAQARPATDRHTVAGWVRGTTAAAPEVLAFKGIRYAQPPVGELRWRPPVAPALWSGTQDATHFGASCPQVLRHSVPPFTEEFMEQGNTDEDCLYLNIWVPKTKAKGLPVIVFFHGGSFTEGSGDISAYDGSAIAAKGVIVITANYRLGALGYLATHEMEAENPDHTAGNFGLRDQIGVLHWINQNALAFGGDARAVTVMGQSAGARSVQALLAAPAARGLFRSAIAESGIAASTNASLNTLAAAEERGEKFMEAAGVKSLAELRALPVDKIMQAQGEAGAPRLIVDGVLVPSCIAQMERDALYPLPCSLGGTLRKRVLRQTTESTQPQSTQPMRIRHLGIAQAPSSRSIREVQTRRQIDPTYRQPAIRTRLASFSGYAHGRSMNSHESLLTSLTVKSRGSSIPNMRRTTQARFRTFLAISLG